MHKIVIFDFDDVLAETLEDMLRYAEEVCEQLGHPCKPTRGDLEALERMSFDELARQLKIPEDNVEDFTRRSFELFISRQQPPPIFDEIYDAVTRLSKRSKIGIVTGNTSEVVWDFLDYGSLGLCVVPPRYGGMMMA